MFYSRSTINEIDDLQDSSKLFELLTQPTYRGDYPYWIDIWEGLTYFCRNNSLLDTRFFYDDKKFKELEKFGLDYNHRDSGGNNFFQYALAVSKNRGSDSRDPKFIGEAMDYIISKTDDICKPNSYNRNILFDMLSHSAAGIDGEEFFQFLKQHPGLDIYIIDKGGKNLLFEAILRPAPHPVINYLIEKGVPLNQIDNDSHNLLHMFFSFGKGKNSVKLFDTIFESIDDISLKNKYGDSAIEFFITCAVDNKVHQESRDRYNFWTQKSLEKLTKGEFKKDEKIIQNMINILEKHKSKYKSNSIKEDAQSYERALKSLNYFLLDMTMNTNENTQQVKKLKI
jgi:hypothetical protein